MSDRGIVPGPVQIIAVLAIVAAGWSVKDRHDGWAFDGDAVAIGLTVATIFIDLYPNVMVSSTSSEYNLTVANAASGDYSLKIMSIVAIVLFPIVLVYQGWNYYTFRHRIVGPRAATPGPDTGARRAGRHRLRSARRRSLSVERRLARRARLRTFMSTLATAGCTIRGHERCRRIGCSRRRDPSRPPPVGFSGGCAGRRPTLGRP